MSEIFLKNVTKNYGNVQGVSDITITLKPGITGILGPNGAGKSTTMKLILGLSRPSIGYVDVNGSDPFVDWKLRKDIGFVPEYDCFYEHMTGMEYVSYFLRMHDVDGEEADEKAKKALIELGLEKSLNRKIRTYSRGMRQKTKVARATVFDPKILVLDEPFAALDAFTREELWCVLRDLWIDHKFTTLLVTHDLREAAFLADKIFVMSARPGKITNVHNVNFKHKRDY